MNQFLLFIFLVFATSIFGQKSLHLIDTQTKEQIVIKENEKIKIFLKSGSHFKGEFKILNDSMLLVKETSFSINSIQSLKYLTHKQKIKQASGISLIVVGSGLVIISGGDFILTALSKFIGGNYNTSYTRPIALLSSGITTYIFGIKMIFFKKYFNTKVYSLEIHH